MNISPYYQIEGDRHRSKLFAVMSGATLEGAIYRAALGPVQWVLEGLIWRFSVDPVWVACPMLQRETDAASWPGTSLPAQPRDDGACPGKVLFVKRRIERMATIAHRLERRIDLAERSVGHGGITTPFGK